MPLPVGGSMKSDYAWVSIARHRYEFPRSCSGDGTSAAASLV
jgi:hypothetical protein